MLKRRLILTCAAVVVLAAAAPTTQANNVNVFLGQKNLDEGDWDVFDTDILDVGEQDEFGILTDWGVGDWPVALAVDLLISSKDKNDSNFDIDIDGSTWEIDLGVRKYWGTDGMFRPYVGGGLGLISAKVEAQSGGETFDDDDSAIGWFVNGGLSWRLAERFNLGVDVRYSDSSVEVSRIDFDQTETIREIEAGGLHYGLLFGFGW